MRRLLYALVLLVSLAPVPNAAAEPIAFDFTVLVRRVTDEPLGTPPLATGQTFHGTLFVDLVGAQRVDRPVGPTYTLPVGSGFKLDIGPGLFFPGVIIAVIEDSICKCGNYDGVAFDVETRPGFHGLSMAFLNDHTTLSDDSLPSPQQFLRVFDPRAANQFILDEVVRAEHGEPLSGGYIEGRVVSFTLSEHAVVPEPSSIVLVLTGLMTAAARAKRTRGHRGGIEQG